MCKAPLFLLSCLWISLPLLAQGKVEKKEAPGEKEAGRAKTPGRLTLRGAQEPVEDGKAQNHDQNVRQGWIYLLDSRVTKGGKQAEATGLWRTRSSATSYWQVLEDGGQLILRNALPGGENVHGVDLISRLRLWDFELHAEFRVPSGSNSGIYLRGRYEIQLNGLPADKGLKPSKSDLGAIYNVREPLLNASRGPGEWQVLEASIRGFQISSVRLNGELIHASVQIPDDKKAGTGSQLGVGDGESDDVEAPGPIFLQGDHGAVDFRNIRVRTRASFLRAVPAAGEKGPPRLELKKPAELEKQKDSPGKSEKQQAK